MMRTYSRSDFKWDEQANEYRCPEGHALRNDLRTFKNPRTRITKEDTVIYRSSQHGCATCAQKDRCCPNTPYRKIARSIYESARDVAREIYMTPEYQRSRRERKKIEMLFAHSAYNATFIRPTAESPQRAEGHQVPF